MDGGVWWATLWLQSQTWLSIWACMQEQRKIIFFFFFYRESSKKLTQHRYMACPHMLWFKMVLFLVRGRKACIFHLMYYVGFSGGSDGKASACNVGDPGSILGSGKSPGEENVYSLQYSCLGNSIDRGAWWATVPGVAKSQTRLSVWACMHARKQEKNFFFKESS